MTFGYLPYVFGNGVNHSEMPLSVVFHLGLHGAYCYKDKGPQGFWGSGENDNLFSGSCGALFIIFWDLGSKLIVLGI